MSYARKKKKYKFKPNAHLVILIVLLIVCIRLLVAVSSCNRYDRSIRGSAYTQELNNLPEHQVRACQTPTGEPNANYFAVYPPKTGDKVAYLTFDDGPSAKVTPQVLDTLRKYNVKATFFVVGTSAEKYPELVQRAAAEGHSICSHSYSHNYSTLYSSTEAFTEEVNHSKEVLINLVGEDKYQDLFRFPGGAFDGQRTEFKETMVSLNIPYVNWNCLTGDAETKNPVPADLIEKLKKSSANATADYRVVLMHDAAAKQATADALPGVIEYLQSEGYRFDSLKRE